MSDTYAWFGCAYFVYDMWSMYMVHVQKIGDKARLLQCHARRQASTQTSPAAYDKAAELQQPPEQRRLLGRAEFGGGDEPHDWTTQLSDGDVAAMLRRLRAVTVEQRPTFWRFCAANPVMTMHHVFLQSFGLYVIVVSVLRFFLNAIVIMFND